MWDLFNQLPREHPWLFWPGYVLFLLIAAYWLRAMRLAREGLRHFALKLLYAAAAVYLVGLGFWTIAHVPNGSPTSPVMFAVGFVFLAVGIRSLHTKPRARRRTIPRGVRQAVVARDLGNVRFDPSRHHIDHIWPFSKGGSHTPDNLRVIAKKENLRKGAKRPRVWDMW
jgi:hypothetical protein